MGRGVGAVVVFVHLVPVSVPLPAPFSVPLLTLHHDCILGVYVRVCMCVLCVSMILCACMCTRLQA